MSEKDKQERIIVEDRRYFDREGNPVGSLDDNKKEQPSPVEEHSGKEYAEVGPQKVDFIAILFSFVHTALVHLGDLEDPTQRKVSENLEGARQMIDVLELLQEKTKGNLTQSEEQYLESALFDLRMRYMQKAKVIK